jgi:hypothetical protein
MNSRAFKKTGLTISLILVFLVSGMVDALSQQSQSKHTKDMTTNVVIFSNRENNAIKVALGLDDRINETVFTEAMDTPGAIQSWGPLEVANVVVIDTYLPKNLSDVQYLLNKILEKEMGVILFGGNYSRDGLNLFESIMPAYFTIDRNALNAIVENTLSQPIGINGTAMDYYKDLVYNTTVEFTILDNQIQVSNTTELSDTLFIQSIAWQSCPLLRHRFSTFAKKQGANTLVEVPDTKEPLIVIGNLKDYTSINKSLTVMFISTGVAEYKDYENNETKEMNTAFKLWPYFNYFMYLSVFYCTKTFDRNNLETYAIWPYSPIPHEREATLWMIFVAFLWVFNFALFFYLGKKKKTDRSIEAAGQPQEGASDAPSESQKSPGESTRDSDVKEL